MALKRNAVYRRHVFIKIFVIHADRGRTITSIELCKRLTALFTAKLACKHATVALFHFSKTPSTVRTKVFLICRIHLADSTKSALILLAAILAKITVRAGILSRFDQAFSAFRARLTAFNAMVSTIHAAGHVLITISTFRAMQTNPPRAFLTKTAYRTQCHAILAVAAFTAVSAPIGFTLPTVRTRCFLVRRVTHD
jgi:hypothetical protein